MQKHQVKIISTEHKGPVIKALAALSTLHYTDVIWWLIVAHVGIVFYVANEFVKISVI